MSCLNESVQCYSVELYVYRSSLHGKRPHDNTRAEFLSRKGNVANILSIILFAIYRIFIFVTYLLGLTIYILMYERISQYFIVSSSNCKYEPFPLSSYSPWLCVWDICIMIFRHPYIDIDTSKTLFSQWYFDLDCVPKVVHIRNIILHSLHLIVVMVQNYLEAMNTLSSCRVCPAECV